MSDSHFDLDYLRARLTIKMPTQYKARGYGGDKEADKFMRLFRNVKGGHKLMVPRAFDLGKGVERQLEGAHPDSFPLVEWPKDSIVLGPNKWQPYDQRAAYEALVAPPDSRMGKLFVLGCGRGKTSLALKAAHQRLTTMLVVVDSAALAKQWVERIKDRRTGPGFTDVPILRGADDITKHWTRKHGGRRKWEGAPICIALAQTLMQKQGHEWPEEFRRYFGLVVFDECHIMGAPVVSRIAPMFYGERWGLTATPDRQDTLDVVFRAHIGEPCFVDVEQDCTPEVTLVDIGQPCPDMFIVGWGKNKRYLSALEIAEMDSNIRRAFVKSRVPLSASETMRRLIAARKHSIPLTVSRVTENEVRNEAIIKRLKKLEDKGRTILVLGGRTTQLVWLYNHYTGDAGLVHGKVKEDERDSQLNDHKVVFVATKIGTKGLDRPAFDTLVITALDPILATLANVQQSTGRIQRFLDGKLLPVRVIVFIERTSKVLRPSLKRYIQHVRQLFGDDVKITLTGGKK